MKATTTLIIAATLLLAGCKTAKQTQTPLPVVPIETRTEYIHTERIDTCYMEIPAQSVEKTTMEGFSHLETDYAQSDARINEDGTLSHTLANKTQPKPVPVKATADTIREYIEKPIPVEVPREVEVERNLTWWERTRLASWGWLAAIAAGLALWTLRKPLLTILTCILKKTP